MKKESLYFLFQEILPPVDRRGTAGMVWVRLREV
jgi:hypothetical protein